MSGAPGCVAIVPARYGSTRFPGKPLALLRGKPVIQHVVERVRAAGVFDAVWVATDDERIVAAVQAAGVEARWTRADHPTGTERVAEAAQALPADCLVVNVQGDEPLVPPALLGDLVRTLRGDPAIELLTAAHPATDAAGFASPHVVKVVLDAGGRALYFSRAGIPHPRGAPLAYLRHVGVYAFRRAALTRFVALEPGPLESREGLEQLRALEHGMAIHVLLTAYETIGIDTPADLESVASRLDTA